MNPKTTVALDAMHRRLRASIEARDTGAITWAFGSGGRLPSAPDLRRRFRATEETLDRMGRDEAYGKAIGGDAIEAAVAAHEAVWRAIVMRHREHAAAGDRRFRDTLDAYADGRSKGRDLQRHGVARNG